MIPEEQAVGTARETGLGFPPAPIMTVLICRDVIWPSICIPRCQSSKTFHGVYQRHEKTPVNNLLSIYICLKAQSLSHQTILSKALQCLKAYIKPAASAIKSQESSWLDSPSPPVLHAYAFMQLHTAMEKAQHACWQLLSIKQLEQAWKGLSRHFSLQLCPLWFMISETSIA